MSKRRWKSYSQMPDDSVWHGLMLERARELVRTRDLTVEQIAERTGVSCQEVRRMFRNERKGRNVREL